MGFEFEDAIPQEKMESGFETDSTDLDNGQVSGTSTVKASRRRQRPQPEVKSGMGRSGVGSNEPDSSRARPIRQVAPSGSYSQPRMMKENSEFGYLFTDDEPEDTHMTSTFANRLDGLAYDEKQDGEGEQYDELFSEPSQSPMVKRGFTSRGKKAKAEAAEPSKQQENTSQEEPSANDFKSRFSKRMKKKEKGKEEKPVGKEPTIIESQDTAIETLESGDDTSMQAAPYPYPYPPQYPYGQQYQQYPPYPYPYPQPYPYPPQYPYQPQYSYPPQAPYPPQYGYPPQQVYAVMQPIGYIYQPGASQPMSPPPRRRKPTNIRSNSRRYGQLPYDDQLPKEQPPVDAVPPVAYDPVAQDVVPDPVPEPAPEPTPAPVPEPAPEPVAEPTPTPEPTPEQEDKPRFNRRSRSEDTPFDVVAAQRGDDSADAPAEDKPRFNRRSRDGGEASSAAPEPSAPQADAPSGGEDKPRFNRRSRG